MGTARVRTARSVLGKIAEKMAHVSDQTVVVVQGRIVGQMENALETIV